MSLAQGEPFVLTYRLGIIGLAQWVDTRHARSEFHHFVSQFEAGQSLSRQPAAQISARQTTSLGDFTVAQLTVTGRTPCANSH